MKMKGAKQVHYDSGPNMTPLVDVVMVILIFLMLAGSFAGSTRFLMSKQAIRQKGSGKADPNAVIEPVLEIHVTPTMSGFRAEGEDILAATPEDLKNQLDAKREKYVSHGAKIPAVDMYPSGELRYEYLIQAYDAILRASFDKVAFATTKN